MYSHPPERRKRFTRIVEYLTVTPLRDQNYNHNVVVVIGKFSLRVFKKIVKKC